MTRIVKSGHLYFALFHGVVWLIYAAGYYAEVVRWEKPDDYWQVVLLVTLSANAIALLLSALYMAIEPWRLVWKYFAVIVGSASAAGLWSLCKYAVLFYIYAPETRPLNVISFLGLNLLSGLYIFVFWSALYFLYHFYQRAQENHMAVLRAESLANENRLKLLSSQLNPHFLFNTLNSIASLILKQDTERAHQAIVRLSDFLRASLDGKPWRKITLTEELESVENYLDIQKTRFGSRLKCNINAADGTSEALLPALILQPLIENAIKHTIDSSDGEICIDLVARREGAQLFIQLKNTVVRDAQNTPGAGVGLKNVVDRLQAYYGSDATLHVDIEDRAFTATMVIPWQT